MALPVPAHHPSPEPRERPTAGLAPIPGLAPDDHMGATPSTLLSDQRVRLDDICCPEGDLNPAMVTVMQEDIAQHGLLSPPIIDNSGAVVDGHHRVAALLRLRSHQPDTFKALFPGDEIAVKRLDLGPSRPRDHAVLVALAGNALRRPVGQQEVLKLLAVFKSIGQVPKRGRPKEGERPVKERIAKALNRSPSWVSWVLQRRKIANDYSISSPGDPQQPKLPRGRPKGTTVAPVVNPGGASTDPEDEPTLVHGAPEDHGTPSVTPEDTTTALPSTSDDHPEDAPPASDQNPRADVVEPADAHPDKQESASAKRQPSPDIEDANRSAAYHRARDAAMQIPPEERPLFYHWVRGWYRADKSTKRIPGGT